MRKLIRLLRHDWAVHFILCVTNWLPDNTPFLRFRGSCLRPFLGSCGKNLRVGRNVTFYNASKIVLGKDVYVACGCWFMADETIRVGDEVLFGPYCVIVSSDHTRRGRSFRYGVPVSAPIGIGDGCWLGAHVTVAAGVTIGSGALVAAGAVVSNDVPDDVMAGGVPARVVKELIAVSPARTDK